VLTEPFLRERSVFSRLSVTTLEESRRTWHYLSGYANSWLQAWTDGVTYKDWQNYHKLRNTLNEWQAEVEAVGARHEGLRVAHEEAKKLEDEAMTVASNMVAELVRLKDVSKSKIWAGDATADFSDKIFAPRIRQAAQQVVENVGDASSQVSEAVHGSSTPLTESMASSAKEAYSQASSQASEAIRGSSTPLTESVASSLKEAASKASSQASEAIQGTPSSESLLSQASSKASEVLDDSVSMASAVYDAPKKVFGGANAQTLEAKQIIFDQPLDDDDNDDNDTHSSKLQDTIADAGERAAEISRAVSEGTNY
jgi:hypothetical protein